MEDPGKINSELGENSFYLAASSAGELSEVFDAIGNTISTVTTTLNDKATIVDKVPSNFTISANAENISLKVANCIGENNGALTFATPEAAPEAVKAKRQGNTVLVNGFNFSDKWCGKENDAYRGQKLIVSFDITHNNYGGTQPTNDGACIKDASGESFIDVDNPSIPVKITEPCITGVTRSKVYDGTGFDVLSTIAEDINALADGKKNAYVDIVVTVTSGSNTYTYTIKKGETTGSWDKTGLTTDKDVKIEKGAVSSYTYDLNITFKDATAHGADDATKNAKATYTITKRPVTLTSGSNEKKYDGTPLTKHEVTAITSEGVGFVGGDGATYTFTGSQTEAGESDNTFDYILNDGTVATNYEITKQVGKLKVTKDDTTKITVTITGTQETKEYNGQTQEVVGFIYTVEGGAAHDDVAVTLKTGKEAKASGKDVLVGTDGKYDAALTYPMHLTADYFDVSSTKYSDVTIKEVKDGWLKITPRAITLRSSDASKTYDGTALTNTTVNETGAFATGEGLDYNVTGSQTEVGTSKNTYTYTPKTGTTLTNYTITKEEGDLTVTLPDLTALPNVTVDCVNTEVPAHTAKNTSLTNTEHYTVSPKATKVDGQNAYTRTIALTDAGRTYFIDEYNKEFGSHALAATGNVTEITMTYSEVNGEWAWRASHANFLLKVECTTPTVEVDLGNYVKKTLTGTNFHDNFSAEFKVDVAYSCDGNKTAVGSVTLTGAAQNTPFVFNSNITLKQGFYYIFAVTEREANVSGVTCDTTTHEFALNVKTDGNVEFGSVVDKQFVPAGAESDQFLTINNEYTRPSETFDLNSLITKNFEKDPNRDGKDIPTGTYTFTAQIFEADEQWQQVGETPAYIGTATLYGADTGVAFDFGSSRYPTLTSGTHKYLVKEVNDGVKGINYDSTVYRLTITVSEDGTQPNVQIEAEPQASVLSVQSVEFTSKIIFTNTYFEKKDPNALYLDFSKFVQKELTATGTKTASDVNFTVNVKESPIPVINSTQGEGAVSTYAGELLSTTLNAHFDSITGGETKTEQFTGSIEIKNAGVYRFELTEVDGQRTGVTYDETVYKLNVTVEEKEGKLVVSSYSIIKDGYFVSDATITFHNTIDTGRDDYIPIIIPTIINKDTGMLNKTDHFAYVIGYPDGTVHPNGQITRAEVATIFFRLLRDEVRDGAFTTSNSYSDVAYGKWYNNPISTMSALGIITGYPDGTFKPNKPITRAEFAAIAARFDETQSGKSATFSDVIGHWAAKEIGIAYYNDWIKGYPDGTFKPDQNITRAEAMTLINRVLERKPESPADLLTNMNKWTDNLDTSKWYYLDVQEATNSHAYTRKTFNYELWRQMLPDPDWSRYER